MVSLELCILVGLGISTLNFTFLVLSKNIFLRNIFFGKKSFMFVNWHS